MLDTVPVGGGYLEATAGISSRTGAYGRLELGYRPWERVGLFAFGAVEQGAGAMAGIGTRVTFGR